MIYQSSQKQITDKAVLMGDILENGSFQNSRKTPRYVFKDAENGSLFAVDEPGVFKNILLLGGPGSGKTNVMNQIIAQNIEWNKLEKNSVSLIFDTKEDFIKHPGFYTRDDYIISNNRAYRNNSVVWNVFLEALADGNDPLDYESNCREIANILFRGRGSESQPFFVNAARDIMAATMIYFVRRHIEAPERRNDEFNNKSLVKFLMSQDPVLLMKYLSVYPDMRGLSCYIGDGNNNQSIGVMSELRSMLTDCFQGQFAQKADNGDGFSIRRAIREKSGKSIFLIYDMAIGEILSPMYTLLIDLALKEALSGQSNGRVHLFLDELKLLPKIQHLEDALNFGRGKKLSVVAGLQSVSQIYSAYDEYVGNDILAGFGNVFTLRLNDYKSREFVRELYGNNLITYEYPDTGHKMTPHEREGYTVEDWDLLKLIPGKAVIGLASQSFPFLFKFEIDSFG